MVTHSACRAAPGDVRLRRAAGVVRGAGGGRGAPHAERRDAPPRRYLRHLPLTTEYTVVELDLEALVGAEPCARTAASSARGGGGDAKLDAERREAAVRGRRRFARARARVFGPETRRNMPRPPCLIRDASPRASATTATPREYRDRDRTETRVREKATLRKPTPSEALARRAPPTRKRVAAAEAAAAREAPGTRRDRAARRCARRRPGLRVRSGRAGSPEGGLEGDAFGPAPRRDRRRPPGPAAGRRARGMGAGAEDAPAAAAAAAEAPGRRRAEEGRQLSLTSGGRRY